MKKNSEFLSFILFCLLGFIFWTKYTYAEERVLQKEEMSFDTCLVVIEESSKQLMVNPDVEEETLSIRIAKFKMSDGTLLIKCDGINNELIVSLDN